MNRCENCDLPQATQEDFDTIPGGEGGHLCWAEFGTACEPAPWRERALGAVVVLRKARALLPQVGEQMSEFAYQELASLLCDSFEWEDAESLQAERDQLKAEVERLERLFHQTHGCHYSWVEARQKTAERQKAVMVAAINDDNFASYDGAEVVSILKGVPLVTEVKP